MRLYTTAELSALSPNLMQRSFTANLMRIEPNGSAPMTALTGMAHEMRVAAVSHSYYSKRALFPSAVTTAVSAAGDTTIPVSSAGDMMTGGVLMFLPAPTGVYQPPELLQIDSIAGNTLTVTRELNGSPGYSIPSGATLIEVGSAFEEGSAVPAARSIAMAEHTNFTQIFRQKWDATETAAAVNLEPNVDLVPNNKEDAMFFLANQIERSIIWGRKGTGTKNGKPIRYMDGIESIVSQFAVNNLKCAGVTTNFKQLEDMLHPTLDHRVNGRGYGQAKTLFVGSQALQVINEIGRASGYYELVPNNTVFGMQFHTFRTSRGTWELIEHPQLNAHPQTKGMCIIADMASFDLMWLRDVRHKDIAYDGTDAVSGDYTGEGTMQILNPLGWGIIYDLRAGA